MIELQNVKTLSWNVFKSSVHQNILINCPTFRIWSWSVNKKKSLKSWISTFSDFRMSKLILSLVAFWWSDHRSEMHFDEVTIGSIGSLTDKQIIRMQTWFILIKCFDVCSVFQSTDMTGNRLILIKWKKSILTFWNSILWPFHILNKVWKYILRISLKTDLRTNNP
jgi:hypothetical protein